MIEFIAVSIFYLILSLLLIYRVAKGPTAADRVVAGKSIQLLLSVSLIAFTAYTGRGIYLDAALVLAMFGFIGTLLISRYLEEKV